MSVLVDLSTTDYNISGITTLLQVEKGITEETISLVRGLSLDEDDGGQEETTQQEVGGTTGSTITLVEVISNGDNAVDDNAEVESNVVKEGSEIDETCDTNPTTERQISEESESVEKNETNETEVEEEENKKVEGKETVKKDVSKLQSKVSAGKVKKSTKKKILMPKSDHRKPNVSGVVSRLADYIKSPLPVKLADDHGSLESGKNKKNLKKSNSENKKTIENNLNDSGLKVIEIKPMEKKKMVKDVPKIIIKKSTPKSKWGNIMSQIEANKEDKPKPKVDVKSKLETHLHSTPPPKVNLNRRDNDVKKEKKTVKKIQSSPIPNYNKVKSKLNLAPTPTGKQESLLPAQRSNTELKRKLLSRKTSGLISGQLDLSESCTSSQFSSRTDVSIDTIDSRPSSPVSSTKISSKFHVIELCGV